MNVKLKYTSPPRSDFFTPLADSLRSIWFLISSVQSCAATQWLFVQECAVTTSPQTSCHVHPVSGAFLCNLVNPVCLANPRCPQMQQKSVALSERTVRTYVRVGQDRESQRFLVALTWYCAHTSLWRFGVHFCRGSVATLN